MGLNAETHTWTRFRGCGPWNTLLIALSLSVPSPEGSGKLRKRRHKECKSQSGCTTPRKAGLVDTAGPVRIGTHRDGGSLLRACAAGLGLIGSRCRGEVNPVLPVPNPELFPIDSHSQRNLFSPMEPHWVYKPLLRAGPIPSGRWPT